jgi:hypothetical protein
MKSNKRWIGVVFGVTVWIANGIDRIGWSQTPTPKPVTLKYARELIVAGKPVPKPAKTQVVPKGKHVTGRAAVAQGKKELLIGPQQKQRALDPCFKWVSQGEKSFLRFDPQGHSGSLALDQRLVVELVAPEGGSVTPDLIFGDDWVKGGGETGAGLPVTVKFTRTSKTQGRPLKITGKALFTFCPKNQIGKSCRPIECEF